MMADNNAPTKGYEYEPESGGKYLSLKKKGDSVQIRIVSTPKHKSQHWITGDDGKRKPVACTNDSTCTWCGDDVPKDEKIKKAEVFAWLVIDRADGEVKMFQAPKSIYLKIRNELLTDDDWGDPVNYDLKITRTEEQGNYYSTIPTPKNMGPITEEEKKLVDECDIDLEKELEGGKDTKTFGSGKEESMETVDSGSSSEDSNSEGDEEETDEDIPF